MMGQKHFAENKIFWSYFLENFQGIHYNCFENISSFTIYHKVDFCSQEKNVYTIIFKLKMCFAAFYQELSLVQVLIL